MPALQPGKNSKPVIDNSCLMIPNTCYMYGENYSPPMHYDPQRIESSMIISLLVVLEYEDICRGGGDGRASSSSKGMVE